MTVLEWIVIAWLVYLAVGLVIGVWLMTLGASRLDPRLSKSPMRVRVLLLPGCAALWPVLLRNAKGASS